MQDVVRISVTDVDELPNAGAHDRDSGTRPRGARGERDDSVAGREERLLIDRLQRADVQAITHVYQQNHIVVRAFAQRLVGDVEAAEDLVQDVFVALPNAIGRFRGDCALRTFLLSIAVNHAKNHVRAAARRRAAFAKLLREPDASNPFAGDDPHHDLERRELGDRLMHALDALPLDQRVAIVLAEIEDRTSAEIAKIVEAPEGTVRTRIFHAKKKLRELLSNNGKEAGR